MTRGREHTYAASKLVRNQCKQRKNGRTISNKALHLCSDVQNPPQFRNVGVAASRCENSGRGPGNIGVCAVSGHLLRVRVRQIESKTNLQLMKLGDISRKNAVSRAHPGITCDNSKIRSGDGNRRSTVSGTTCEKKHTQKNRFVKYLPHQNNGLIFAHPALKSYGLQALCWPMFPCGPSVVGLQG